MYDIIIIGAGPAGLSAGIYCARANLKTLIIEKASVGGLITKTDEVANYPGASKVPTGTELTEKMREQAVEGFGARLVIENVVSVDLSGKIKKIITDKQSYEAKAVIVATGSVPRLLSVPGEKEYTSKGIGYCATCDAPFFQGLKVYVIGSGEAAVEEAIYLTKFAREVTVVVRKDKLKVAKSIEIKANNNEKLKFLWNTQVEKFEGEGILNRMTLVNNVTGEKTVIEPENGDFTFGVFIFVGYIPQTELFKGQLDMENGYILSDESMRTSIDGVFVAGDVRKKELRQVVTAVSDGAIAAVNAGKFVECN